MGRSENSRNRVFIKDGDEIVIHPFDASKVEDPSLIIYSPVRVINNNLIVTNGDQTDTVYDFIKDGKTFEQALETREFEPDSPNWTPRITGMMTFANGSVYDGNYENDTMNGNGTFTWSSGATYTGSFENEMKSGKGIMTFASGDVYTGDFAMDMRNGNGHYQWANGSYYVGAFRNNLMDTRLVDEKGAFVVDENGEYVHGEVAYYTIVSEDGNRTFVGYFENGKIAAVYNKTEEGA